MKKMIAAVILLTLTVTVNLAALEGTVIGVEGKTEYQVSGGAWKPLKQGDVIASGTMISTGFRSNATVKLGSSILTIRPLTRMTLVELAEKEDVVDTELFIEVGNVRAEVNSHNKKRNGFTVRSPVATASVRGTIFEAGSRVIVRQGSIRVTAGAGKGRTGQEGQSFNMPNGVVESLAANKKSGMNTIPLSSLPATEKKSIIDSATGTTIPTPRVLGGTGSSSGTLTVIFIY